MHTIRLDGAVNENVSTALLPGPDVMTEVVPSLRIILKYKAVSSTDDITSGLSEIPGRPAHDRINAGDIMEMMM